MKTKEQWLEEFKSKFAVMTDEGGEPCMYLDSKDEVREYFSNALEQYAKEYCLEVVRRSKPETMLAFEATKVRMPMYVLGFNEAVDDYESAMKKEIGV